MYSIYLNIQTDMPKLEQFSLDPYHLPFNQKSPGSQKDLFKF